jgi:hypothetical protein
MELDALAKADNTLFQGDDSALHKELLKTLCLSTRVKFPTRRLRTL